MTEKRLSHQDVRRLVGDVDAHTMAAIIESGASEADLEEVAAHLALEDDVMGEARRPLTGRRLRIFELIRRDEEVFDDEP